MLVVVAKRGERDLLLAVARDQKTSNGYAFGQRFAAQGRGGQRLLSRVHLGEDGFAGGGHVNLLAILTLGPD